MDLIPDFAQLSEIGMRVGIFSLEQASQLEDAWRRLYRPPLRPTGSDGSGASSSHSSCSSFSFLPSCRNETSRLHSSLATDAVNGQPAALAPERSTKHAVWWANSAQEVEAVRWQLAREQKADASGRQAEQHACMPATQQRKGVRRSMTVPCLAPVMLKDRKSSGPGAFWQVAAPSVGPRWPSRTQSCNQIKFNPDMLKGDSELSVVTSDDPMLPDVSLDLNLETDISLDQLIGHGVHGSMYSGTYHGHPVAVKFAQGSMADGVTQSAAGALTLHQEVSVLSRVRHQNIVRLYGCCLRPPSVCVVEEFMEQSLSSLVHNVNGLLDLDYVLRIGRDIATGLFQLHPTVVHRGLNSSNVLLDRQGVAKISGFSLARFRTGFSESASVEQPDAGTTAYLGPEWFQGHEITPRADVYSWAVIMAEMLTGEPPWRGFHTMAIIYNVAQAGNRPCLPEDKERCPPELSSLIRDCWSMNPKARPAIEDVLKIVMLIIKT